MTTYSMRFYSAREMGWVRSPEHDLPHADAWETPGGAMVYQPRGKLPMRAVLVPSAEKPHDP